MGKINQQEIDEVKEKLMQLNHKLTSERPVKWNEFPDIGLYKDQVLSYEQAVDKFRGRRTAYFGDGQ